MKKLAYAALPLVFLLGAAAPADAAVVVTGAGYLKGALICTSGNLIDLATDFGRMINVGRTRGFIGEGEPRSDAEARFLATAGRICEMAARKGVTIIIEPVNRYEINFINSVDEGAALSSAASCCSRKDCCVRRKPSSCCCTSSAC